MMEHKAFLFDYEDFRGELQPILEQALISGDVSNLRSFIELNILELTDPYEGKPLTSGSSSSIENGDIHEYRDFALTKYYSPQDDRGLGAEWEIIQQLLERQTARQDSPILGNALGPRGGEFDPGRMGSYFQSPEQVQSNLKYLRELNKKQPEPVLEEAIAMLGEAEKQRKGLYVTF